MRSAAQPVMSAPSKWTLPAVGRTNPAIIAKVVVFPAPLGPSSAVIAPSFAVNETERTACSPPNRTDRSRTSSRAQPRDATG